MKLEQQCCSLEQGKRLKELGVTAEPLFWHVIDIDPITPLDIIQKWQHSNFDQCEKYPAYTVAELGVMLPEEIGHKYNEHSSYYYMQGHSDVPVKYPKLWVIWYEDNDLSPELEVLNMQFAAGDTEAEARAAMLIYLLENHLTTPEEVNQRLNK